MRENKLYLQFKDNKKKIEFDLNKNTVFFGNNGQGKTRILKTINSLYVLAKEKKTANFSRIIDSMNLEKLKINNVNYNELFSANENLKETEKEKLYWFINENRRVLEKLELFLNEIFNEDMTEKSSSLKFDRILRYLKTCNNLYAKRLGNPSSLEGFNRWLKDTQLFCIRLKNQYLIDFNSIVDERSHTNLMIIEETLNLISYLKERYHILIINSENNEIISQIEENKENILKSLSIKSAHYITTDNIDIMNTRITMGTFIDQINNRLMKYFWSNSSDIDKLDGLEAIILKRNELYSKIKKFNDVIEKYTDIKVEILENNDLIFIKNSEEMDFDKLSSGERKISFLFLEIIFNNVDIYLIDEPELSLSLNFQNKIITDLHILTKGKTLFIATHAPYIYEDFIAIEGNISKEV
ncbi:AAA family ATPase [Falsibacillus pallidus]|uniref:AAA family ATPase n=1 Tax=Falsibacillus pallidus TaxID=493781 RepID=UPI003D98B50B